MICCVIFGINNTRDMSKLSQISLAVTNKNFETSLLVFMPSITTNHAITYIILLQEKFLQFYWLRAVVFQLNLKYLLEKITKRLRVVV